MELPILQIFLLLLSYGIFIAYNFTDSYDAAYKAETVLLEKSDLDSTDVELIYDPMQIANKKRQRKPVVRDISTPVSCYNIDEDERSCFYSSDDQDGSEKLPSIICNENESLSGTSTFLNVPKTDEVKNKTSSENFPNNQTGAVEMLHPITENVPLTLPTEKQVNELKELVVTQSSLIQQQSIKIVNLTEIVTTIFRQLKKFKADENSNINGNNNVITLATRWHFPMKTLDEVKELDEMLKNDENGSVKEFVSKNVKNEDIKN